MRVEFYNMKYDEELKNILIELVRKNFKDDDINFNNVEIIKHSDFYSINCNLMFDYTNNKNSLYFRNKLNGREKFPYEITMSFKEYNSYLRNQKLKNINMYNIDKVYNVPVEEISCPGCGRKYGHHKTKVDVNSQECSSCVKEYKYSNVEYVDAKYFIENILGFKY
jgi:hypothetical protein